MKKSELRQIIREEINRLNEKKFKHEDLKMGKTVKFKSKPRYAPTNIPLNVTLKIKSIVPSTERRGWPMTKVTDPQGKEYDLWGATILDQWNGENDKPRTGKVTKYNVKDMVNKFGRNKKIENMLDK